MPVERQTLWTGAVTAGATIAAVAVCGIVLWNLGATQRAELTALNAKVDQTRSAIAEIQKISTMEDTGKALAALNADIQKTNARLTELQQASSLDGIKGALTQLDSKVEKTGTALTELKKATPLDGIKAELEGIKSGLNAITVRIESKIEASDKALAEIKAGALQAKNAQPSGDTAIAGLAETVSAQSKSLEAITNSIDTLKTAMAQTSETKSRDHLAPRSSAVETTSSIPAAQPLIVRFDDSGRANLDTQTSAVIGNLKTLMKDRRNCTISVAGYSDTYGRDDANLDVSQQRADMVSAKLKPAFATQAVQIDSIGWGERRLKVWTPDGTVEMANRRVEVSMDCKG
jgi:outer membrane protein OmpA-like peptidoglycan-associated protein